MWAVRPRWSRRGLGGCGACEIVYMCYMLTEWGALVYVHDKMVGNAILQVVLKLSAMHASKSRG